jgi:tetratricopeptide (TPR) repeat protein
MFQAELLLAEGQPHKALEICENAVRPAIPIMTDETHLVRYNLPFDRDTKARAYVSLGNLQNAIQEYEKLISFDPESQERRLIHPRFHYRLAKLYDEAGQNEKALQQYQIFLDLWKDADPGIAEVEDARERVAALRQQ